MRFGITLLAVAALLAAHVGALTPIQPNGMPIQGAIEPSDNEFMPPGTSRSDTSYYRDVFSVERPASGQIDILLNSSFDGYLYLFGPDNSLLSENDDYQSTSTSRISVPVTSPGTHYIVVTTYSAGATGGYTLTVSGENPDAIEGTTIQGSLDPSDTAPVSGMFDRSGPGYYRDVYPGPGTAGQTISIDLISDFDGYLYLIGPGGQVVASNDDYRDTRTSRIDNAYLPETGTYQIVVTSFSGNTTGNYTLTIGNPVQGAPPTADMPISPGMPIQGQLMPGDGALLPNAPGDRGNASYYRDGYVFPGSPGQRVQIDLTGDFDGYLYLMGPDGQMVDSNDDFGSTRASRILTTLTQAGPHRLIVTSFSPGTTGNYTLTAGNPPPPPPPTSDTPISMGQTINGQLDATDNAALPLGAYGGRDGEEYYRDGYAFQGSPGQQVQIDANYQFDGYLFLVGPNGMIIDYDDDNTSTSNSQIVATLTIPGLHRIVVTSFSGMVTGPYTLTLGAPSAGGWNQPPQPPQPPQPVWN